MTWLARLLVPIRTASGIPITTVIATAMPVMMSRSSELRPEAETPNDRNEPSTSRAIRQSATARPM